MPGAGGILTTTMTPIVSYFLALAIGKRLPNPIERLALGLGVLSCFFLLHLWRNYQEVFQGGNLIFLISCLVWAFLSRVTAKANKYGSPLAFTFWMYVIATICLNLMTPYQETINLVTQRADSQFWINILYNGVINAGIATTIFFYVTTKLGAAKTSMFIYIVPFAAAISSWVALGERIYWYSIVGGLIGIIAILVINSKKLFQRI
jgi:drug/metabolite transporter (DMT)-like permease